MHLVLDIDGTLKSDGGKFRPHLPQFLNYCFDHFSSVSIWSASSKEYVDHISKEIIPKGKQWLFVHNGKYCHISYGVSYDSIRIEKRLYKIWKQTRYKNIGMNAINTLIIDDTPSVCRNNYGNAIYVHTYKGRDDDTELLTLMRYFDILLSVENVRTIDKRHWRSSLLT